MPHMTSGKVVGLGIVACGLIAGAALYYLQVYHYYVRLPAEAVVLRLTPPEGGLPVVMPVGQVEAIDSESSPIRFRACFRLPAGAIAGQPYPAAEPLNAPGWFGCFDADAIAASLADGTAQAYLGEPNVVYGIDRVVALYEDGRGRAWHQINRCGEAAFDGDPVPAGCPPPPARTE